MRPGERLAVIDLGSNSFRLVVFQAGDGWWRRTDEIYEPVRISEGLAATGELGEEPIERALATLDVFDHFCRAAGLEREALDAVATSAIRDATNRDAFLALAGEHFDAEIRVLSGEQEANYGYLAAVNSTTLDDGCVLELGGGSMQIVRVAGRACRALLLVAARHGAHDRALPAPERPRQAPSAAHAARFRDRRAREGRLALPGRRASGWRRRHDPQPRGRRPTGTRRLDRWSAGGDRRARLAGGADRASWRRCRPPSARASPGSSRPGRT